MPPVTASAPSADVSGDVACYAAYLDHLARSGRGNTAYWRAARVFFRRWPDPQRWAEQPLTARLSAGSATRPIITFLMLHRVLRPGYDYLLERKLSSIWREIKDSPLGPDLDRFLAAAAELGFTERVRLRHRLAGPGPAADPDRAAPGPAHRSPTWTRSPRPATTGSERTGTGHKHYLAAVSNTQRVLFHLGDRRPAAPLGRSGPVRRAAGRGACHRSARRWSPTWIASGRPARSKTVSAIATRLEHFGGFLADVDPGLDSLADLDRRRHIEPYLTSLVDAVNAKNGELITVADRVPAGARADRRS